MPVKDQVRPRGAAGRGRPRSGSELASSGRSALSSSPVAQKAPSRRPGRAGTDVVSAFRRRATAMEVSCLPRFPCDSGPPRSAQNTPRALASSCPTTPAACSTGSSGGRSARWRARKKTAVPSGRARGRERATASGCSRRPRPSPAPSPPGRDEGTARPGGAADPSPGGVRFSDAPKTRPLDKEGEHIGELLPVLAAGELTHVGGGTSFGLGRIEVRSWSQARIQPAASMTNRTKSDLESPTG